MLVAQPQRQCELRRCLPVVLEEIGLTELVRMKRRGAENPSDGGGLPAKVIQEVGKSGIPKGRGRQECNRAQRCGLRRFREVSPQKFHTIAERVAACQLGLRLLKQEVVAIVELAIVTQ